MATANKSLRSSRSVQRISFEQPNNNVGVWSDKLSSIRTIRSSAKTNYQTFWSHKSIKNGRFSFFLLRHLFLSLPPLWWIVCKLQLLSINQTYSQAIHNSHGLVFFAQITGGGVGFNWDSAVKSPGWCQVFEPATVRPLAVIPTLQDLAIFIAPYSWAYSIG